MVIRVRDAANLLHVSQKTLYRWIKNGTIPFHMVHGQYCFERFDLFNLAVKHNLRPVPVIDHDKIGEETLTLSDSLENGGIYYNVSGTTKQDVLRNALNNFKGIDPAQIDPFFELFLTRETLSATVTEDGIAIPHTRGPLIGYVNSPQLSLSFLENPIELNNQQVKYLFLLISPTVRSHITVLGKLAFALRSKACKDAIITHASSETILNVFKDVDSICS